MSVTESCFYILYTYRPIVGLVMRVYIMIFITTTSCKAGCCIDEYHYINTYHKTHNRSVGIEDIKATHLATFDLSTLVFSNF